MLAHPQWDGVPRSCCGHAPLGVGWPQQRNRCTAHPGRARGSLDGLSPMKSPGCSTSPVGTTAGGASQEDPAHPLWRVPRAPLGGA
jgi:hypothetical protein